LTPLTLNSIAIDSRGQLGWQDFYHDLAAEEAFDAKKTRLSAATGELALDLIARAECGLQVVGEASHDVSCVSNSVIAGNSVIAHNLKRVLRYFGKESQIHPSAFRRS
jgi:hypothetical protein